MDQREEPASIANASVTIMREGRRSRPGRRILPRRWPLWHSVVRVQRHAVRGSVLKPCADRTRAVAVVVGAHPRGQSLDDREAVSGLRAKDAIPPADADIEGKIKVRMARQERLTADDAPEYWAVLNEAVIRRVVGPDATMRAQLDHLVKLADLANVTIQVLPFGAGVHPAMDGGFSILGFPEPVDPAVVYLENAAGSAYLEEPAEVARFDRMFSHIIAKALSPEESRRLLRMAGLRVNTVPPDHRERTRAVQSQWETVWRCGNTSPACPLGVASRPSGQ